MIETRGHKEHGEANEVKPVAAALRGMNRVAPHLSISIVEDIRGQAQTFLQRVFDVVGEQAVDGIGLVAGEFWQALGLAVGAGETEDGLHHAQETGIGGDAVGDGGLAVAADDTAAIGREVRRVAVGDGILA